MTRARKRERGDSILRAKITLRFLGFPLGAAIDFAESIERHTAFNLQSAGPIIQKESRRRVSIIDHFVQNRSVKPPVKLVA